MGRDEGQLRLSTFAGGEANADCTLVAHLPLADSDASVALRTDIGSDIRTGKNHDGRHSDIAGSEVLVILIGCLIDSVVKASEVGSK